LLITDYDVAGITGIELSARVKEINEKVTTILLSGWMLNDIDAYQNVIDLFIPKPFRLDDMIKKVSQLLFTKKS
jgi:two-component SAPR family response regulator